MYKLLFIFTFIIILLNKAQNTKHEPECTF